MADESLNTPSDRIIKKATEAFIGKMPAIEGAILEQLFKEFRSLTLKEGNVVPNDSANKKLAQQIEQRILDRIKKTSYFNEVSELLTNFDEVEKNATQLQLDYSDIEIDPGKIKLTDLRKWAVDNAFYSLKEAGFKHNVIQPLTEALTRTVVLGGNLSDLEAEVTEKTKGSLGNYTGGVVRDLFSQYEGVIQKKIETVYDLNAILYVGGIKLTSRPQCKKWVKMGVILKKDLQDEIDWALRNGSGMITETTPDNFTIYRGGWGCLHKAIPTRR